MKHEMQTTITDFFNWDHQLNEAVTHFKQKTGHYPNMASGNSTTLGQIDVVANVLCDASIEAHGSPEVDEFGFKALSGFSGRDYHLEFARDESIEKNTIRLIYDENPLFD
jgi:hypothetical protein